MRRLAPGERRRRGLGGAGKKSGQARWVEFGLGPGVLHGGTRSDCSSPSLQRTWYNARLFITNVRQCAAPIHERERGSRRALQRNLTRQQASKPSTAVL